MRDSYTDLRIRSSAFAFGFVLVSALALIWFAFAEDESGISTTDIDTPFFLTLQLSVVENLDLQWE